MRIISIKEFGKDHWSLLGYIETCCVDRMGSSSKINHDRMRTNPNRNPPLGSRPRPESRWKDEYSTRLKSFPWSSRDEKEKAKHRVTGHDDWDCLEDLEQTGLANLFSYVNGFVKITNKGFAIVAELRAYKANGGSFSTFTPSPSDTIR